MAVESTPSSSSPSASDFVAGCRLSINTILGEHFEAQQIGQTGPHCTLRFLKANCIKETSVLGRSQDILDLKDLVIDVESLKAREEAAIRQAEAEAERIGIGVSKEAQDIFDALSKTLPVRWDNTMIVVMNEVRVSTPYFPENVSGGPAAANERVKKVLELERKRLEARGAGQ